MRIYSVIPWLLIPELNHLILVKETPYSQYSPLFHITPAMFPSIRNSLLLLLSAQTAIVAGVCHRNYIFAARETSPGLTWGSTYPLVSMIALANPDAAAETIGYWACTGDPACKISYGESVERGTMAVVRQVHKMHESCPETQFVLVGFGQVRASQKSLGWSSGIR